MRLSSLPPLLATTSESLREFALMPSNFSSAFDDLTPEERMAIVADLATVSRLSSTLIELIGDYYRE